MNSSKLTSLILLGFLLILSIPFYYTPILKAQSLTIKVTWRVYSDPSENLDYVFGVCEAGDYIYIVGDQNDNARIEMRFKSNGSLVKVWNPRGFYTLFDCVIVNNKLYVVGRYWSIFVLDLELNLLASKHRYLDGPAYSVIFYDEHIYIAGWEIKENDDRWVVGKWRADNLTLVKEYTSNPSSVDQAYALNINPITKQLWIAGVELIGKFRVEILDLDLNPRKIISKEDRVISAYSLDFDEDGYAYIGGYKIIAKYDKDGNEVVTKKVPYIASKLLYSKGYIFIAAVEKIGKYMRHVLYIYDKNLNQVERTVLSQDIDDDAKFIVGKMALANENLYIAGIPEWTIYSISISASQTTINHDTTTSPAPITTEGFNLMYFIIGVAVATTIITIIFVRKKYFKLYRLK
jgi:hypothetical protein